MPIAKPFTGRYRFPGIYAFIDRPGAAQPCMLQFDDPFTGTFDDLAAQNTCATLQKNFQDGDDANLTGLVRLRKVNGTMRPILFLFD